MPTAKQKKQREQRETAKQRRLHGQQARPEKPTYGTVLIGSGDAEVAITIPAMSRDSLEGFAAANPPSMSDFHDITLTTDIPARATCPACGFSQKVRRDGTIGAHVTATSAEVQNAGQCPGAGQLWITASPA